MLNLNKVSRKKLPDIKRILNDKRPAKMSSETRKNRIWLVKYLRSKKYTIDEIVNLIHEHNSWGDYNRYTTRHNVEWLYLRDNEK